MTYVFVGGLALLAALAAFQYLRRLKRGQLMRSLRWVVGGAAALIAGFLLLARRFDMALFAGAAAFSILRSGRLGPFSFDGQDMAQGGNVSRVKSYYFAMELDHDTGTVEGRVLAGQFAGAELIDLGEMDTRLLIAEIEGDPDSTSLLESWLDANRSGWREYFAQGTASGDTAAAAAPADPDAEAYAVLGLQPGASDDDIRAAHRELMKGVHPDHGGSSYLASKINAARDQLLKS